jgi:hypothetical protein
MASTKGTLIQGKVAKTTAFTGATTTPTSNTYTIIPVSGAKSATVSLQICAVESKPANDDVKVYVFLVPTTAATVPATVQDLINAGYAIEYATIVNPGDVLNRSCDIVDIGERFVILSTGADINFRVSGVVGS